MWVRVFNFPLKRMEEETGKRIGNKLVKLEDIDISQDGTSWGRFLRRRVLLDVKKTILRSTVMNIKGRKAVQIYFLYERTPIFCFFCGCIGYNDKECEEKLEVD